MSACLCTGVCKKFPYTCNGNFSTNPLHINIPNQCFTPSNWPHKNYEDTEITKLQNQISAIESSIEHQYGGIEKCFEWLDKVDPSPLEPNGTIPNIFEFIAVDAKRRDDIRHIKNSLYELYTWILANVQDNRWRSKGIESLEEAAMWLNKSISRRKDNGTQTQRRNDRQS